MVTEVGVIIWIEGDRALTMALGGIDVYEC